MLELVNISKGMNEFALQNISFSVQKGEYFVILGPSGAGKSVILEIISGLIKPDKGEIYLNKKSITQDKIQNRKAGILFQDLAIFPHLTVRQNIEFGLKQKKLNSANRISIVNKLSSEMGIDHLMVRRANSLSGGEKQRVALARILAIEPECLLLDEPLSSVDTSIKEELWYLLKEIHANGQTIIHVTHDFEEAMILADRVAVVSEGKIMQIANKYDLIKKPQSKFVADFVGIKNYFSAMVSQVNGHYVVEINKNVRFVCNKGEEGRCHVMIRSSEINISANKFSGEKNIFPGKLTAIVPGKNGMELKIDMGIMLTAFVDYRLIDIEGLVIGKSVWVKIPEESVNVIYNYG